MAASKNIAHTVGSAVLELECASTVPNADPQFLKASISHAKHLAHTLRPATCEAFGSLLTLDIVTHGLGSKPSQEELSRNSAMPKTSHRGREEAER